MNNLLKIERLSKTFHHRTTLFRPVSIKAVKSVSFTLQQGQTLAIIGENGSGKSTLVKMITGMLEPTSGEISVYGKPLVFGDYRARCQCIRMVFQDPTLSLNPQHCVGKLLETLLKTNTDLDVHQRAQRISHVLKQVGLLAEHAYYYPYMLAAGQKQRVAFARALILQPQIIIADEALAYLDLSIRAQIINLMLELQETYKIAYIYVTQHLGMIKHISDQLLVMQNGQIVERGDTQQVLAAPVHPLTQRLVSSYFENQRSY